MAIRIRKICTPVCRIRITTVWINKAHNTSTSDGRQANNANLSRVERSDVLPLHHKHVDEVDEDAGGLAGVPRAVRQPLVEDHEDQVAEETEEEEQLGEEQQVDVELLSEVPAREIRHKNKTRVKKK